VCLQKTPCEDGHALLFRDERNSINPSLGLLTSVEYELAACSSAVDMIDRVIRKDSWVPGHGSFPSAWTGSHYNPTAAGGFPASGSFVNFETRGTDPVHIPHSGMPRTARDMSPTLGAINSSPSGLVSMNCILATPVNSLTLRVTWRARRFARSSSPACQVIPNLGLGPIAFFSLLAPSGLPAAAFHDELVTCLVALGECRR
jgi:hypothetical protein